MRNNEPSLWRLCGILAVLLVLGVMQSWAQLDTGNIVGVVRDSSGAVLHGATVKITNTKTGENWTAQTGSSGFYSVPDLPVGPYQVEVTFKGFKTQVVSELMLHSAESARADVTLTVGSVSDTVNVTAEAETTNTTTSDSGATIDSVSVTNLPLNGRDFTALLALVPGSVTTGQFGQNSLGGFETSLAGVNILLDGSDATRIDVNATSTQLGRQESRISRASVDSIQEFTVLSGVYSAQYGRSEGDVVNVITKSGGNAMHGTLFEFLRNNAMDAKNYFATTSTPLRLNQFGGNLSGPIIKDKLFYFVNYEGLRQSVTTPIDNVLVYSDATRALFVPSMLPVINAIPRSNDATPVILPGPIPRPDLAYFDGALLDTLREDTGSIKVDYLASANDHFALRYNIADSFTNTQYGVAVGQVSPSTSRNHLLKLTWDHNFSPALLNQFGVSLNRPQTDSLGGGGDFPIFQCNTFFDCTTADEFGDTPGPALFSNRRPQHSFGFTDTASWVKGRHTIHFGFDIRHNVTHDALDPQYFLSYLNISDFENNNGFGVSTLGHTMVGVQNTNYAYFVQDDIHLTPRFTMNLGLRYEYNSVLQGDKIGNFDLGTLSLEPIGAPLYKPDRNNFAPRIGFAWDVTGKGKTVLRAGGGIFYNPLLTGAALSLAGNYQQSLSINILQLIFSGDTCNPPFNLAYPLPTTIPTCTGAVPNVNSLDPNMRDSYSTHWSFGLQQELARNTVLEVNYVGNRGVKLPAGAAYAGLELNYSPFAFFPNQLSDSYGNIRRLGNFLESNYNSLQVSLRRHVAKGLNIDANYTWGHELDDAVNILLGAYQNSHDPKADYASGDIDVRHNFTIGAVYDLPGNKQMWHGFLNGWLVSPVFQIRSGLPVNIALSAPFLGIDQLRPNLVPGQSWKAASYSLPGSQFNAAAFTAPAWGTYGDTPRNFGRGPGFAQVDVALAKTFKINERLGVMFRAEMFNLLNHPNFASPSGYLNDPNFGKSTSTISNQVGIGTSRQTQLALKVIF